MTEIRWDVNGDAVFYRRGRRLVRHPLAGGDPVVIHEPLGNAFAQFDLAHADGTLVFGDVIRNPEQCVLRTIVPGGVPVELSRLPGECFGIAWTPDRASVLAATWEGPFQPLWRVDRASGRSVRLPISSDAFWDLSVSPDGKDLLFTAGNPRPNMVFLRGIGSVR